MKAKLLFSGKDLRLLPPGFQFFYAPEKGFDPLGKAPPRMIKVDICQTASYHPSGFYKPISKIFRNAGR